MTFGKNIEEAAARAKALREQLADLPRKTRGHSPDSVLRAKRKLEDALKAAEETHEGMLTHLVAAVDAKRAIAAEVAQWSRPMQVERLLPGTKHAAAARERRLRYLAAAKASVGTTPEVTAAAIAKSADDTGDLAQALETATADVLEFLANDTNQTGALIERLRTVIDRVAVLLERGKTLSAVAPKGVMSNAIANEISRALSLAGKIRNIRSGR